MKCDLGVGRLPRYDSNRHSIIEVAYERVVQVLAFKISLEVEKLDTQLWYNFFLYCTTLTLLGPFDVEVIIVAVEDF